jgi:histidinol phosphatase-like enzyme (inositol monophosphatase family)
VGGSSSDLGEYLSFAEHLARSARRIVSERVERDDSHRLKADGSFVTDIDLLIEEVVRSRVAEAFPGHGILGEELPESRSASTFQWVIDPIDGTRSLRHRIPLFGTLIALLREGVPVVGVIDLPMLDRRYAAASGMGARCNGRALRLADLGDVAAVQKEVIAVGERRQFAACGQADAFDRLMSAHESVRTYCDCFGHALAIEGAAGAMVDYNLHLWDFAASEILTREAGGLFIRIDASGRSDRAGGHYDVVFGKPAVVEWVRGPLRI